MQKTSARRRTIARHTLGGVAFGICFPVAALAADALFLRPDPAGIAELVRTNPIHLIVSMAPLVLGTVFFFFGISRANLDEKNEMLNSALRLARAGETAKREFLAAVSHEIRTPMNGILGMVELLARTDLDVAQAEYLETARMSGEALLRVISNVLDSSQIESGDLVLAEAPFEIRALLDDVTAALKPHADRKALDLVVHAAPEFPPVLMGDLGRLAQVTRHLLGNAVKFTEAGRVSLRLSQEALAGDVVRLRVEVGDTGRGVAPGDLALIFEKFRQVDASFSRAHEGAGLGLWISRGLIARMGGEIGVDSRPGRGSTFWFTVPLAVAAPAAPVEQLRIAS